MPPLIPFPGLSMFIHIMVIIIIKSFCYLKRKVLPKKIKENTNIQLVNNLDELMCVGKGNRCVSTIIIITVLIVVSGTAGIAVWRSVASPYSNIHLAKTFLFKETTQNEFVKEAKTLTKTTTNISCPTVNKSSMSLVDYLVAHNIAHTFENRFAIAYEYGISTYKGTSNENLELLSELRKNSGDCIGMNVEQEKDKNIDESRIRY